jgi:hypothetical protein
MANKPIVPTFHNPETAPVIYFDIAPAYGIFNGAIQIELAGRTLKPAPSGPVEIEFLVTGRLRCSPIAAGHLREAIDKALEMLKNASEQPAAAVAPGKLN